MPLGDGSLYRPAPRGSGNDDFVFAEAPWSQHVDHITDFVRGEDKILLQNSVLTGIGGSGALESAYFNRGTQAADGNDRIIHNPNNGYLFYDEDGHGSGDKKLIAILDNVANLYASDFEMI